MKKTATFKKQVKIQEEERNNFYELSDEKVSFGILKRKRTYQTRLCLELPEDYTFLPPIDDDIEITIKQIGKAEKPQHNQYEVIISIYTRRTGIFGESFEIHSQQGEKLHDFLISWTVMGKDKGTPILKSSVICTSLKPKEDDSDESDQETEWQGFDSPKEDLGLVI